MDLDRMINLAVASAEVRLGTPNEWVLRQSGVRARRMHIYTKPSGWTKDELRFVDENLGRMTYAEIGDALGRSGNAVKIQQVRRQMRAPSKREGWLTGNSVAKALGVDIHAVMKLHASGLMQFEVMAGPRHILLIERKMLYRWATRPEHWMMFRLEKMGDLKLQSLVRKAQARWGDEWWRIGDVARYHGVISNTVNNHIRSGKLAGVDWGNWWVRKSDAIAYRFFPGKGKRIEIKKWSKRADEFLIRARHIGKSWEEIGRMMKWPWNRAAYRWGVLNALSITLPFQGAGMQGSQGSEVKNYAI